MFKALRAVGNTISEAVKFFFTRDFGVEATAKKVALTVASKVVEAAESAGEATRVAKGAARLAKNANKIEQEGATELAGNYGNTEVNEVAALRDAEDKLKKTRRSWADTEVADGLKENRVIFQDRVRNLQQPSNQGPKK